MNHLGLNGLAWMLKSKLKNPRLNICHNNGFLTLVMCGEVLKSLLVSVNGMNHHCALFNLKEGTVLQKESCLSSLYKCVLPQPKGNQQTQHKCKSFMSLYECLLMYGLVNLPMCPL